jgi:hypothetical protein
MTLLRFIVNAASCERLRNLDVTVARYVDGRRFAQFKLCAHFLDVRRLLFHGCGESFNSRLEKSPSGRTSCTPSSRSLYIVTAASAHAARLLQERSFADVFILEVGIDARSEQIDPRVPTY